MYKRILIASDGSEGAGKALAAALELAKRLKAELHMVCVEELPLVPEFIEEVVEEKEAANRRFNSVIDQAKTLAKAKRMKLQPHVIAGHVISSITELIEREGFDLLVAGFTGHSALYTRIIGSTADELVDSAPCAVLVVK